MTEKSIVKKQRILRKNVPIWITFRRRSAFFGRHFRDPAPNGCKGAPGPQNHRFVIKILAKSDAETDLSEFSLFSSQHLWRTWGPQDGAKFRTLRSFLFLAKSWGEPCSCTLRIFLGVRRCHAARRLQYSRTYWADAEIIAL